MTQVKVSVTQELIDKNRHRCNDCPVFDAMKGAGIPVAMVMSEYWIDNAHPFDDRAGGLIPRDHPSVHKLPEVASNWVKEYDAFAMPDGSGTPPKPFGFYVSF